MNLIDRYIAEVGKHLPRRNRADIEAEIRSTLEDMLEERKQAQGPVDDAATIELLKEYGAPRKVAESYVGPRYLIGPRMYPIFALVTKIVMACVFGALLLAFVISGAVTKPFFGPGFISFLAQFSSGLFSALISTFGGLVLTFAIMERVMPADKIEKEMEEEWNPADLAKEPDPDEVKLPEAIAAIIFTVIGLVILNLYPNLIGLGFFDKGEWIFITPVLTKAFFSYLPWINILMLLQIGLNLYLMRQGVWNMAARVGNILLELANIALAVVMLQGPALVSLTRAQLAGTPLAEAADFFVKGAQFLPIMVLGIVVIVSTIEVVQAILRLLKSRTSPPYPVTK